MKKELTVEQKTFVEWLANPKKAPKTQREYAKNIGVGEDVLSNWKRLSHFKAYYKNIIEDLYRKHEAEIVDNFGEEAKKEWKAADAFLKHVRNKELDEEGIVGGGVTIVIKNPFDNE